MRQVLETMYARAAEDEKDEKKRKDAGGDGGPEEPTDDPKSKGIPEISLRER